MSFDVSKLSVCRKGHLTLITKEQNAEFEGGFAGEFNLPFKGKPLKRNILLEQNPRYDSKDKKSPRYIVSIGEGMSLNEVGVAYQSTSDTTGLCVVNAVIPSNDPSKTISLTMFEREGSKGQVLDVARLEEKDKKTYNSET